MRSAELRSVFRRVLALSLLPPAALAACGGGLAGSEDADGGSCNPKTTFCSTGPGPTEERDAGRSNVLDAAVLKADAHVTKDGAVMEDASWVDSDFVDSAILDASVDTGCVPVPLPPPPDDAAFQCVWTVPLPCSVSLTTPPTQAECKQFCGTNAFYCNAMQNTPGIGGNQEAGTNGDDAAWVLQCISCAIGRRPEGFASRTHNKRDHVPVVGLFFASAAELEAASVSSFERLERELSALGAPADLRRRARSAAEDEKRHARVTRALATHFGGRERLVPEEVSANSEALRDLEQVALENAIEGCVRETFGALTATRQAQRATDPRVRAAMRRIAIDETAHAALAWSIASWTSTKLDAEAQARVHAAMCAAIDGLVREMATDPPPELETTCGLPSGREAASMLENMRELLWAA